MELPVDSLETASEAEPGNEPTRNAEPNATAMTQAGGLVPQTLLPTVRLPYVAGDP